MRHSERAKHTNGPEGSADKAVKDIRRATPKRHATEEKIRIALEGLRGEYSFRPLPIKGNG